jgi:4-amino-4-deoxy-L-arabinose transferase-like glycosyltransferase
MQYEAAHPHAENPVIDERSYDEWAREIASGEWLGDEVFFQEPLYPYGMALLYSIFGPDRTAVRHAQVGLGAIACVLVALLTARAFGRRAGIVAGLGLAVYRPALWLPALLLKENLFLFALVGVALLVVRARSALGWLAVGVVAALGALLRGNLLVLLPCFVVWPVARAFLVRERVRPALGHAAAAVCGVLLVLLPVAVRNHAVGGVMVLSTSGAGTNLYGGNNVQNPYGRATEFDWVRGIPEYEAGDWRREAERRTGRVLNAAEVSDFWRDQVFESVRNDPGLHVSILWNKLRLTLGSYEVPDNHLLEWDARYVGLLRWPLPGFGVFGALGLAGLGLFLLPGRVRPGRASTAAAWQVALLAALYAGTVVLTVTSSRIRMPLVPLLAPFAGYFVTSGWGLVRDGKRPVARVLAWLGCLAAGATIAWVPVFSAAELSEDLDKRDYNLAVQYIENGRDAEARALVGRLLAAHPRSGRLLTTMAQLDWHEALESKDDPARATELVGRTEGTLTELIRQPELNVRERYRANKLLGWVRLGRGDGARAVEALRRAEAFDRDDDELRLALARALILEAEQSGADKRVALLREARERAIGLAPGESDTAGPESDGVVLVLARTEFRLGRALLDRGAAGQEKEFARGLIRAALKRLEPLADAPDDHVRRVARRLAGFLQLYLGNAPAAERHFRGALGIDATDREAGLGLAQALIARLASDTGTGAEAARDEARRVLDELEAAGVAGTALADLRRRLAGL